MIGNAVHIVKIATGEVDETVEKDFAKVCSGKPSADRVNLEERSEIDRTVANARWE